MITNQERAWTGQIGADYTDRSIYSVEGLDRLYLRLLGVTRTDLNQLFLGRLSRSLRILEAGCNIGMQLRHLQAMGFPNLCGIELQQYALDRLCVEGVEVRQGSVASLPYPDKSFDLVFTSGVLIHIHPDDLPLAMSEIKRCAGRYIWGFEYFSETTQEITRRKWENMLWSADYAALFLDLFPDLALMGWWTAPYVDPGATGLVASMYLLERKGHALSASPFARGTASHHAALGERSGAGGRRSVRVDSEYMVTEENEREQLERLV